MKTTIEIADDLFDRARRLAIEKKTTLRALTEEGLRLVLKGRRFRARNETPPMGTFAGKGLAGEFKNASWDQVMEACYGDLGA